MAAIPNDEGTPSTHGLSVDNRHHDMQLSNVEDWSEWEMDMDHNMCKSQSTEMQHHCLPDVGMESKGSDCKLENDSYVSTETELTNTTLQHVDLTTDLIDFTGEDACWHTHLTKRGRTQLIL